MAGLLRKRKGKAPASTSEAPRFKTLYHESHFNKFFAARERLTKPFLTVGYSLVREFYANAWRLEEHKNQPLTYTTQIRGTEINFSPESIHRVLKLRDTPLPNAASYHDRKANNNLRLDEVLACLCVEGAQWVRHPDGRPHFLRRTDLQPMARGEDIQVDEIIVEQMYKFVNKTNTRSKLPFPSVIGLLCKEEKVTIPGDTLIPQEDPLDGIGMGRVRGPREPRQRQQVEEEAPQQQPQQFQQQQDLPPDFMVSFNNTMATMQQHYDQRWDTLQQKFDDAQEENRRNFGAINQRMNQMDDQLSFLCYSHQMVNESMMFPYQNTTRKMREME
ncbi:hypothetical protein PIB30_089913 [Stylosanthes scabra]|uniref:Putative plant transposon protein domain-containing protein n=1 Tax=Stylosanthes scabra TaxID=79078 RepID=A0ABU6TX19_9FABA|nr:hypothetical protein [Stylosanthes scabra]